MNTLIKSAVVGFDKLAEPERSDCCFDPLKYVHSEEDITDLASAIVLSNVKKADSKQDPFWDDSAISLLSAECALVREQGKTTFADVVKIQNHIALLDGGGAGIRTTMDIMFDQLMDQKPDSYAGKYWRTFRENPERTAKCVFTTINTTMDKLFTSGICAQMREKPYIDFGKIASEKSVIFVTTSPVKKTLHSLAQLFLAQAVKELFELAERRPDGTLPIPVHISFDDFATGGRCANFPEYISIFREKGISSTILLQSEAQLRQMYGTDAVTILDNCDSYVYLGGNNMETAKNISLRLNVPMDEVLSMPVGQAVIFRRGQQPVVTQRYDVFRDEAYKRITREYEDRVQRCNCIYAHWADRSGE